MFEDFSERVLADHYLALVRDGCVFRGLAADDHERWRAGIRAKARADRLRVRTNTYPDESIVGASLVDWEYSLDDLLSVIRRIGFVDEHGEVDLEAWQKWFFSA